MELFSQHNLEMTQAFRVFPASLCLVTYTVVFFFLLQKAPGVQQTLVYVCIYAYCMCGVRGISSPGIN